MEDGLDLEGQHLVAADFVAIAAQEVNSGLNLLSAGG